MTPDQMLEWMNTVGVLACSWPVVVLFLLVAFRQPLRRFIEAMSSVPGSFSLKFGSAELKRDIAQMVTSMHQLHMEVQHDMREMAATSQRLEQILNAAERSQKHNHRMAGLMSDLYL